MTTQTGHSFRSLLGRPPERVEHDPMSRAFAGRRNNPIRPIVHKHYGSVLYQWIGSCTGHSLAQCLNMGPLHKPRERYQTNDDAMWFYSNGSLRFDPFPGGFPPEDTGSNGLAVCKAGRERGDIEGWENGFGTEHTLSMLMDGPVMLGTVWLEGMFDLDADGFLRVGGNEAGGHEYVAYAYGENKKRGPYVWIQNHWRDWGLRHYSKPSRAKLAVKDLDTLLDANGDSIRPLDYRPMPEMPAT